MAREPVSGICIQLTDAKMTRNDMRSLHDHFKGVPDVRRVKGVQARHRKRAGDWRHAQSLGKETPLSGRRAVGTNVGGVTNCSCL